jgi:hypothetical protein
MKSQRAQAIVLIALMMAVLVGFVALAIDSARAFDARRVLQDATDAASLAWADSYQAGNGWQASETAALRLFEKDNRLASGESCIPSPFPTPPAGGSVTVDCTMSGGSGYQLTLTAAEGGASGQTLTLAAQRSLAVALMQVLGGATSLTVKAAAAATANELSRTPALGGLGYDTTCPGGASASSSVRIDNRTNFATITGDIVSNGALNLDALSYVHLAGNSLTRCAPPGNASHITYECWKSGATPPCSGSEVAGQLLSTANRFADPGYLAPAHPSGNLGIPGSTVVLFPGIYTANPAFGSNGPCYFLAPGVYEWQGGLTIGGGLISNELKPPAEPGAGVPQFWQQAHCAGDFTLSNVPAGARPPLAAGSYSAVVTSVRTDLVNGTTFTRESAPSACKPVTIAGGQVAQLAISNVPGAVTYNLYATSLGGTCAGPFNLVSGTISAGPELNGNVSGCPNTTDSSNCTLGHVIAYYDGTSSSNNALHPPGAESAPFASGLPNQNPVRGAPPGGDLANENHCATPAGASVACPPPGTPGAATSYLTPGAVVMYVNGSSCLNLTSGDAFLFSGYQYNWVVTYEPASTTCTNNWNGVFNSAAIGLSYTPKGDFNITGNSTTYNNTWSLEGPMGGIVAGTIHLAYSSGLVINWDASYAPAQAGARLTG